MTLADELTAVWDSVRPIFAESFHADTYQVVRMVATPDGYGGTTETPEIVESGRCVLTVAARLGGERLSGDVIVPVSVYTAELPIDSDVREADTLRINVAAYGTGLYGASAYDDAGRTFEITDVKRGGRHDLFTQVELEERAS